MKTPNIVYLHGLNSSSKIFNYLQSQLPKHKAIFIDYESSQAVEKSLNDILELIPSNKTFIIGHSLGGIIGHLISSRYPDRISGLVSISSPFGGSDAANKLKWIYPSYAILRDMSPKSNIIKEISSTQLETNYLSLISTAGRLPIITGENDGVVTVKSQEAVYCLNRGYINANHFEVMQDPDTVNKVKEFIFK